MRVYADNAATTKMSRHAIDAMVPYFENIYGNPSSLHSLGQEAKEALEDARARVAKCLGCEPREIIFTSGGSEADNQAIISAARYGARKNKKHIISTAFEHHAVLHTLQKLEKEGFEVTLLSVKEGHNITAQQVKDATVTVPSVSCRPITWPPGIKSCAALTGCAANSSNSNKNTEIRIDFFIFCPPSAIVFHAVTMPRLRKL